MLQVITRVNLPEGQNYNYHRLINALDKSAL